MFLIIAKALYFFFPAYIANAVPVLLCRFRLFEFLNVPVDFNMKFGGEPMVGATKTWRGIIGGVFGAMLFIKVQFLIYEFFPSSAFLYLFPYEFPNILILGALFGLGEGFGDVIKSFIKRRLHVKSSAPFFPFDQFSFIGALLLSFLYFVPEVPYIIAILIISPLFPIVSNIVAYKLGWKKVWW